jgi:putative endopeptidase
LTLPRDYYLRDDEHSVQVRDSYVKHIENMFGLLGDDKNTAKANAAQVMNVESNLAKISMADEDLRDPVKTFNKMPVADLQKLTPNFDWGRYLKDMNLENVKDVNVMTPDFFKGQSELLGNLPLAEWKNYLRWQELSQSASFLSSDYVNEHFNFFGKVLSGSQELSPRWERVVNNTSGSLGEAVGEKYVQDNFPPEAKTRMLELVGKLKESMRDSLNHADWMSDETRAAALDKLDKMNVKIGYPDKWKDYSSVQVDRDDYFGNVTRAKQFAVQDNLSKIGQPVDRSAWGMTPQTVNAYYDPSMNEIVFPAAILQPPFFDLKADDATNFGAIGSIIGHEITHGFDDQGSQFDANGNMRNWWKKADAENFQKRIQAIRDQYDGYKLPDGVQLKGKLVSGEAAADLGGSKISFQALQKVLGDGPRTPDANGFTPEQRFYISFAQAFASKERPEALDLQVTSDPHPPDSFRVIGTVGNQSEFAKAFNLKDDAPIMLPPDKRTQLW